MLIFLPNKWGRTLTDIDVVFMGELSLCGVCVSHEHWFPAWVQ